VEITDAGGNRVASSANVTLVLQTGGGTLSGTVTQAAVNGLATFGNLSIDKAGAKTLRASSGSLSVADSSSFTISPGTPSSLAWTNVTANPGTVAPGCLFTCGVTLTGNGATVAGKVSVTDALGNVVSDLGAGHQVTVSATTSKGSGSFTAPTTGASVTLTIAATGAADSTQSFTFVPSNGSFTGTLAAATALGTAYSGASATVTR
jgi:hypothetical protein